MLELHPPADPTGLELDAAHEVAQGGQQPIAMPILEPGTEVIIQGLTKLPEFNGLLGTVQSLDESTGRYDILLPTPAGTTGQRWAKVKRENLSVADQPQPPCHLPSLPLAPATPRGASPLQLSALLPDVGSAQWAALGNLTSDIDGQCHVGPQLALYNSDEWNWCAMECLPTWELLPSMPMVA